MKKRSRSAAPGDSGVVARPVHGLGGPSDIGADAFVASEMSRALSDFEYALVTLIFGFQSWTEKCMDAADVRGLSSLDILVLHAVNHRARSRRQADICMVVNVDDPHLVAYALKKLTAADLVVAKLQGRERHYETTATGEAACLAYRKVREEFLVPRVGWIAGAEELVKQTAGFMGAMSALYAQAGRVATVATAGLPKSPRVHTKR